jgi:hypothetical protein
MAHTPAEAPSPHGLCYVTAGYTNNATNAVSMTTTPLTREADMGSNDLQSYYGNARAAGGWSREVQMFLTHAANTRFEMRYDGEDRWYPAPSEEVAQTLHAYYPDLGDCLGRMLEGEEVASRLARFRVATRSALRLPYR